MSCLVMWSGAFLAVTAEAGVGGTAVVAVVGVGMDDGVGVELWWLPASCGAVSLVESCGRAHGSHDNERDLGLGRRGAWQAWEARECGGESGNGYRTETGTERDGVPCAYMRYACGGSLDKWTDGRMEGRVTS